MYLHEINIANNGPIDTLNIRLDFNEAGQPKPLLLTGRNGSGKSIVLAHVVNAILTAQGIFFEDSDVESGKVFKLRSPIYIKSGSNFSAGRVVFEKGVEVAELQLNCRKSEYTADAPPYPYWNQLGVDQTSHFFASISKGNSEVEEDLRSSTHLFFPPNRHEDPAWLNEVSLRTKAEYFRKKNFNSTIDRPVIHYSPLKVIQDWLLDVIYNSHALEKVSFIVPQGPERPLQRIEHRDGPATRILAIAERVILEVLGVPNGTVSWNVGARNHRAVGVNIFHAQKLQYQIANLFTLSTGELSLIDIFLTIIRDFDLTQVEMKESSDIRGLVIIDEADAHLHTSLQFTVLPRLMRMFPGVQFITTSHSPLFLLGMNSEFGSDGIQILEMPTGNPVKIEELLEFEAAFQRFQGTARFEAEVEGKVRGILKPILYVEGTTDRDYISRAAELLGEKELVQGIEILDVVGAPYLDKLWETYKPYLHQSLRQAWILLYDCDTRKSNDQIGLLYKRVLPKTGSYVSTGIENLFSNTTIQKARDFKLAFIDVHGEQRIMLRGDVNYVPEKWTVNKSEKRNLCDWLCSNGDAKDFEPFLDVFKIIRACLDR